MRKLLVVALLAGVLALPATAQAVTITFSEFAVGTLVDTEYAALGVTFGAGTNGNLPIIANDGAMPGSPVLSPNPTFAGDFWMYFTGGATGVTFESGYWNTVGTGVIRVYDLANVVVATLSNTGLGPQTINLAAYGVIGKIYFDSTRDPAGADIDNLTFNRVPDAGSSLLLLGLGLVGLRAWKRR